MFPYTDPGKTLKPVRALTNYRLALHLAYTSSALVRESAFTFLEAFDEIEAIKTQVAAVEWLAFPRTATASNSEIDSNRIPLQDEYVEWAVERSAGRVQRVTFTTEFLAYYEALAKVGAAELVAAVQAVMPGAKPKLVDLFGPGFNPNNATDEARVDRFRRFAPSNPWINGKKGTLCLAQSRFLAPNSERCLNRDS